MREGYLNLVNGPRKRPNGADHKAPSKFQLSNRLAAGVLSICRVQSHLMLYIIAFEGIRRCTIGKFGVVRTSWYGDMAQMLRLSRRGAPRRPIIKLKRCGN